MTDSIFNALRQSNRKHFHSLWQRAKNIGLEGMSEEEQSLAEIMLAHEDEFFNQFEFADVLADHQFDPDREVDPFLHVALHAAVEKQLKDHDPIEAMQFYNAMLRQRCSRHEALHLLMGVLIHLLFPVLKGKGPFPLDTYIRLLKRYKARKPDKIIDLLNDDPDLVSLD
jgi:hypothetical protein